MTTEMAREHLWERFCEFFVRDEDLGFSIDISRVRFDDDFFERMTPAWNSAVEQMEKLEGGAIANPDEQRMVGHYWLRAPEKAPNPEIAAEIRRAVDRVVEFADAVRSEKIPGAGSARFENILLVGVGGSALGPQLVADALAKPEGLRFFCFDNTDPDGFDHVLSQLDGQLGQTLVIVVSKSGGTAETRNGMLEAKAAFEREGLPLAPNAVAVTKEGSALQRMAVGEEWITWFPMWDWVGGRTSVTSAVGLLPAALLGIDIRAMLDGAAAMDRITREADARRNPAGLLALVWHWLGRGHGEREMIVIPYKDRLALMSRYLQQLVMESLGKERDRQGKVVHQGIAVYGNKGSTDQHAYVQQLRDGLANFFVTFIQVLRDRPDISIDVEPGFTSGDYLFGFLQGTRRALFENHRDSITITLDEVTPRTVGALIALFERAVGLYAELIDVNAYHQPGVEAGKKAAAAVLDLQSRVVEKLQSSDSPQTAAQIAAALGATGETENVFKILEHLAANPDRGIRMATGASPRDAAFEFPS